MTLLPAAAALVVWCGLLSAIDLRQRRLPNSLTVTGAVGVLAFAIATGRAGAAITGALLLALPYLACHLISPAAIGAGDVKLALGLGGAAACGGAQAWVWAAISAPVLTAVAGAALLVPWQRVTPRLDIRTHRRRGLQRDHVSGCEGRATAAGRDRGAGLGPRASPPDSAVPHGPSMCLSTVAALLMTR
jgi:leader peptidase (prepilin peptidase)/N-methyltransferase